MDKLLYDMLKEGVTPFHVVKKAEEFLTKANYCKIELDSKWELEAGKRYYVEPYPSMLVAFTLPDKNADFEDIRMNIATAHTDFPMLKLKYTPDMKKEGYSVLNVEPYGGIIKESWFDRPLGLAGKIILKTENPMKPQVYLYDSQKPVCIIPSLAPHLRKGTKDREIDVQKEMIPVWSVNEANVMASIALEIGVCEDDVLDYDLFLYSWGEAVEMGFDTDIISSPRLDNVTSVAALIDTMVRAEAQPKRNINIVCFFDNEEIGSRSKQGADSQLFRQLVDRIVKNVVNDEEQYWGIFNRAFLLSLDVAHGVHPNYAEKSDPTCRAYMGKGVALKSSASQRYLSDSEASAVIIALAQKYGISVQRTVNRSGMPGGQTLGPIVSSYIPVKGVDMGMPILAMHSAWETGSLYDYEQLKKICSALYYNFNVLV
jgi:aspartyl aminopeptidase